MNQRIKNKSKEGEKWRREREERNVPLSGVLGRKALPVSFLLLVSLFGSFAMTSVISSLGSLDDLYTALPAVVSTLK